MNRRSFLALPAAFAAAAPNSHLQIGVTDWNLALAGNPDAIDLAARLGFAGVEVSLGRRPIDGKLPLDNDRLHATYLARSRSFKLKLISTCLDILHINGLKSDPLGQQWLLSAIEINRKMGIRNMLLPFFGDRALQTRAEMDYVADLLRDFGPRAQSAGVILGIENTNSAEENARILDRAASPAIKVFYDVGNSHSRGYDIYEEIPWLGASRICQFHFKDSSNYLGQGKIDFPRLLAAVAASGFTGYADFETPSPSKDIPADMARNLTFLLSLLA